MRWLHIISTSQEMAAYRSSILDKIPVHSCYSTVFLDRSKHGEIGSPISRVPAFATPADYCTQLHDMRNADSRQRTAPLPQAHP